MPIRLILLGLLFDGLAATLAAQDTIPVLPPIGVTVARSAAPAGALGLPLASVPGELARRGRPFAGLDELLAFLPGVFASDRGDATVDQRLAIRGSGGRANFGIRGIRVLIDGVPATLPDGQTQLGPLVPLAIARIDLARGPMGALHGNGASGVLALETNAAIGHGRQATAVVQAGTAGALRSVVGLLTGSARLGATLFASREAGDGVRSHASYTQRRVQGGLTWQADPANRMMLRVGVQDDPFSASPGALTPAEFATDPDAAAARNVALDAGKTARQRQVAIGWDHLGTRLSVASRAWLLGRDLENPIAAPAAGDPARGTWITLDRDVRGLRTSVTWRPSGTLDLTTGLDAQRMRDDRTNRPHAGQGPDGDAFVDQVEEVTELGAFAQAVWRVGGGLGLRAGLRRDRVRFAVTDRIAPGASGARVLGATTGSASVGWSRGATDLWLGAGQAFETPTTTELTNRPDGATGLNRDLLPARTTSVEAGLRHAAGRLRLEAAAWHATTRDAILPAADVGGRSLFRNVARTTAAGVEAAAEVVLVRGLLLRGTASIVDARFGEGLRDAEGTEIGDRRVPGVPPATLRLGLTARRGDWSLDVDHEVRAATEAYDAGTGRAEDWGAGVTNAAVRWSVAPALTLFAVVRNLTDRAVAGAVVVNAAGGRFLQPLPGRQLGIGIQLTAD